MGCILKETNLQITAIPRPSSAIFLADAAAIKVGLGLSWALSSTLDTTKEVTTSRARFPKPVNLYEVLIIFGTNIVASEGEEWKKYRKIAAPAFSEVRFEIGFLTRHANANI